MFLGGLKKYDVFAVYLKHRFCFLLAACCFIASFDVKPSFAKETYQKKNLKNSYIQKNKKHYPKSRTKTIKHLKKNHKKTFKKLKNSEKKTLPKRRAKTKMFKVNKISNLKKAQDISRLNHINFLQKGAKTDRILNFNYYAKKLSNEVFIRDKKSSTNKELSKKKNSKKHHNEREAEDEKFVISLKPKKRNWWNIFNSKDYENNVINILAYDEVKDLSHLKLLYSPRKKSSLSFYTEFDQKNIAILRLVLSSTLVLSEGITAYLEDGKVFLPIVEFCETLEFPVSLEKSSSTVIKGWFINKKSKFQIDLTQAMSVSNNKFFDLYPENVRVIDHVMYANIKMLEDWLPIKISFDSLDQSLQIVATEKIPIEEAYERSLKWDDMEQKKQFKSKSDFKVIDVIKTPYDIFNIPLTDIRYRYQFDKAKTTGKNSTSELQTFISGDFLYFNNQIFAKFEDTTISSARITSSRKDPDGNMLGPLHARSLSVGDIYTPEVPLVSRSQFGKGLAISSLPENYVASDTISVGGTMDAGWDVEIYRNGSLLDFRKVASNGTYEFQNIDLMSGLNEIKLVFYGPFGQRRTETRSYLLNEDIIKKNKLYYNFVTNKNNENVFQINSAASANSDPTFGAKRSYGELTYGLSKRTSISTNFVSIPLINSENKQHDYRGASIRSSLFGVFGRYDITEDVTDHFRADKLYLQTKILDYNLSIQRKKYNKSFVSEDHQSTINPLLQRTEFKINGVVKIPFTDQTPNLNLFRAEEKYLSGAKRWENEIEISANLGSRLNVSQFIREVYDERVSVGEGRKTMIGRTITNLKIANPINIRGVLSYNLKEKKNLTSSNVAIDYRFNGGETVNLNHTYQFPINDQKSSNTYSININKPFEKYIFGLNANHLVSSLGKSSSVSLNVFTSFGYDARYKGGIISGAPITNSGVIVARVFLDKNSNDKYDDEEEFLNNVRIYVEGYSPVKTNKKGVAVITGISVDSLIRVTLDNGSLGDPFWTTKKSVFDVVSHVGAMTHIDFPVSLCGDIDGRVKIQINGVDYEASNVELEIADAAGMVIMSTKSSYDGFYFFKAVPYGKYKLRISNDQSQRLGLENNTTYDIEVNDNFESLSGFNFLIKKNDAKSSPALQ